MQSDRGWIRSYAKAAILAGLALLGAALWAVGFSIGMDLADAGSSGPPAWTMVMTWGGLALALVTGIWAIVELVRSHERHGCPVKGAGASAVEDEYVERDAE